MSVSIANTRYYPLSIFPRPMKKEGKEYSPDCPICFEDFDPSKIEEDRTQVPIVHHTSSSNDRNGIKHPFHYACLKDHARGQYGHQRHAIASFILQKLPCPCCRMPISDATSYPDSMAVANQCGMSIKAVELTAAMLSTADFDRENPMAVYLKRQASEEDRTAAAELAERIIAEVRTKFNGTIPSTALTIFLLPSDTPNMPEIAFEEFTNDPFSFNKAILLTCTAALYAIIVSDFSSYFIAKKQFGTLFALGYITSLATRILFHYTLQNHMRLAAIWGAYAAGLGTSFVSSKRFLERNFNLTIPFATDLIKIPYLLFQSFLMIRQAERAEAIQRSPLRSMAMITSIIAISNIWTFTVSTLQQVIKESKSYLMSQYLGSKILIFLCYETISLGCFAAVTYAAYLVVNKTMQHLDLDEREPKKDVITVIKGIALIFFGTLLSSKEVRGYLSLKFLNPLKVYESLPGIAEAILKQPIIKIA